LPQLNKTTSELIDPNSKDCCRWIRPTFN